MVYPNGPIGVKSLGVKKGHVIVLKFVQGQKIENQMILEGLNGACRECVVHVCAHNHDRENTTIFFLDGYP